MAGDVQRAAAEDDVEISELTEDDPAVSRRGDGEEVRSRAKSGDAQGQPLFHGVMWLHPRRTGRGRMLNGLVWTWQEWIGGVPIYPNMHGVPLVHCCNWAYCSSNLEQLATDVHCLMQEQMVQGMLWSLRGLRTHNDTGMCFL